MKIRFTKSLAIGCTFINTSLALILIAINGKLPPAPERPEQIIEQKLLAVENCGICSPAGRMVDTAYKNAKNFSPVIIKTHAIAGIACIETKHLLIRPLKSDDLDDLYAYAHKEEVAARTSWMPHRSKIQTADLLNEWILKTQRYSNVPLGVEEKKTGKLIGTATFTALYSNEPKVTFAYCMGDAGWDKGYEVELIKGLCEWSIMRFGCVRIETMARTDDPVTQVYLESAGMHCEGCNLDLRRVGNQYVSYKQYALLADDVREALKNSKFPPEEFFEVEKNEDYYDTSV